MKFALVFLLLSTAGWAKWSVSTYNIRNFDNDPEAGRTNLVELGKVLKDFQSDVMAFVEVVNVQAFETLIKKNLTDLEYKISDCGGFGKQRLALAYNTKVFDYVTHAEDLTFSGNGTRCGSLRPVLLLTLRHRQTKSTYTFGVVHLKAGGNIRAMEQRWQQYKKLEKLSAHYKDEAFILLGDFNTTGFQIHDQDYEKFEALLSSSSLRTTSETLQCTSYWMGNEGGAQHQPSILDHIVVQDREINAVDSVRVGTHCARVDCRPATPAELGKTYEAISDHCPVQVVFK